MLSCALFCVSEDRSTPLAERSAERSSFLDGASFLDGGALADGDLGLVSLRALRVAFAVLYFRLACSAQDCARELGVGGTPPAPAGDDGVSLGGGPLDDDSSHGLVESTRMVPTVFWLLVLLVALQAAPSEVSGLAPDPAALPALRFALPGGGLVD